MSYCREDAFELTNSASRNVNHSMRFQLQKLSEYIQEWKVQMRLARSRRIMETLPEHIRKDIGWPDSADRLINRK